MKFFALDCHIGINDIKTIFERLGHTLDIWSISRATHILGWEQKFPKHIDNSNWYSFNHQVASKFAEEYKDVLKTYDGFVCFYPAAFSLIYDYFEKPIIIQAPIRTDVPFHHSEQYSQEFYNFLSRKIESGKIIPVANNKLDVEYNSILTKKQWRYIPSLCDYTGAVHEPKKDKVIYTGFNRIKLPNIKGLEQRSGYGGMSWEEIYSYKGIVHLPYHNSIMSCFEQYQAGVPLYFPSKDFLIQLKKQYPHYIMNEMSWQQIDKIKPVQRKVFTEKNIVDLANWTNPECMDYWIPKCDWYDSEWMNSINYYNSFEHLKQMITNNEQTVQSGLEYRKDRIINLWKDILRKI